MVGSSESEKSRKIARGVTVRMYATGIQSLRIEFAYRGIACREILKGLPVTKANERYAVNLKAEIESAIARGTFRYSEYFKESKRAALFGHGLLTKSIAELLEAWLKRAENTYPHSTFRAYKKSVNSALIPAFGSLRARDLSPAHLRDWISMREVTLKTIRNDLTPLRAVIEEAVADGTLDRNPVSLVKVGRWAVEEAKRQSAYSNIAARIEGEGK